MAKAWLVSMVVAVLTLTLAVLGAAQPAAADLEQRLGLWILFRLRGPLPPPPSVAIVAMNQEAAARISLPSDERDYAGYHRCRDVRVDAPGEDRRSLLEPSRLERWPRCLHAILIDALATAGASAILFDVSFRPRPPRMLGDVDVHPEQDRTMAAAMRRAGNVIVAQRIESPRGAAGDRAAGHREATDVASATERQCLDAVPVPISPPIREAALGAAPFFRIDDGRVDRFPWFSNCAWPAPTFPMLALQAVQRDAYRELRQELLRTFGSNPGRKDPEDPDGSVAWPDSDLFPDLPGGQLEPGVLEGAVVYLRALLRGSGGRQLEGRPRSQFAEQLRLLYIGPDIRYLNHYGPPQTIETWSYAHVLDLSLRDPTALRRLFENRVVFVGFAEQHVPGAEDHFPTVFAAPPDAGVSGVELAATGFANLSEGSTIEPRGDLVAITGVTVVLTLALCLALPAFAGFAVSAGIVLLGWAGVSAAFRHGPWWIPIVVPSIGWLGAFVVALATQYGLVRSRQTRALRVLEQFVPRDVARQLLRPQGFPPRFTQAIVIATDIANYTALSEGMDARDLQTLMAQYFELVFRPVRDHGGFISDIVGDAMVALWPAAPDGSLPTEAVLDACVDMQEAIAESPIGHLLPTRVGVTSGPVTLAMVGALDHYEFRAVGDPVNTANRIQGYNKTLGTRVLISADMLAGTDRFVVVDKGTAKLRNKANGVHLFELVGRRSVGPEDPA